MDNNPKIRNDKLSIGKAEKVIEKLINTHSLDKDTAIIITCRILQRGGTGQSRRKDIDFTYNEKKLTAEDIYNASYSTLGKYFTSRKLARTLADEIYTICNTLGIPGDLAKKRSEETENKPDEKAWISNFQQDNPKCPIEIRLWLKR